MADLNKREDMVPHIEGDDPELKHQITCKKCGMVYEIRYISEYCRMAEGEGYLCMSCNSLLDLSD